MTSTIHLRFEVDCEASSEVQRQVRDIVIDALVAYVQSDADEISDADEALIDAMLNVDLNPPEPRRYRCRYVVKGNPHAPTFSATIKAQSPADAIDQFVEGLEGATYWPTVDRRNATAELTEGPVTTTHVDRSPT